MARLACIRIPNFELQLASMRSALLPSDAVVLVHDLRPASRLKALNRTAKNAGLRLDMRYGEALAVVPEVKAVAVDSFERDKARGAIETLLSQWSPTVERSDFDPGAFWLDTTGLKSLFGSEVTWGRSLRMALARSGWKTIIVMGWTRVGTYALARNRRTSFIVPTPSQEQSAWESTPIATFPLNHRQRRLLERLGLVTWADVKTWSPHELRRRLGPDWGLEVRRLTDLESVPLQPAVTVPRFTLKALFESAETDWQRLHARATQLLEVEVPQVLRQGRVVTEAEILYEDEQRNLKVEVVKPAEPTTSADLLARLLNWRWMSNPPQAAVVRLQITLRTRLAPPPREDFFAQTVDWKRGEEAVALIQALWGNQSVVSPVLANHHRPDLSFRWEPHHRLRTPKPALTRRPQLTSVRRIPAPGVDGIRAPVGQRVAGPFCLKRPEGPNSYDLEYWFLRTSGGEIVWTCWDRISGKSHWQGVVD